MPKMRNNEVNQPKLVIFATLFSIAMGFLEAAVVIYLRALTYPKGFNFPMANMNPGLATTEVLREFATLVMLASIGYIMGRTFTERFAYFIYCFAVWDLFYYIVLKAIIHWPFSWFTWDILFLIPTLWVGPVVAPVVLSLTMIAFAIIILSFSHKIFHFHLITLEWIVLSLGALVVISSFTWEYSTFILKHYTLSQIGSNEFKEQVHQLSLQYIPQKFNWFLFCVGELIILSGIAHFVLRLKKVIKNG